MTRLSIRRAAPTRAATAISTGRPLKVCGLDERLGVARLQVLRLDARARELRARGSQRGRGRGLAARDRALGGAQGAVQRGGALALGVVQVGVARAQREPVGLAHRGHHDDLDREVEVARHPPDHDGLLGVLLPEERDVGADRVEELRHDRRDPAEVAAATPARVAVQNLDEVAETSTAVANPGG